MGAPVGAVVGVGADNEGFDCPALADGEATAATSALGRNLEASTATPAIIARAIAPTARYSRRLRRDPDERCEVALIGSSVSACPHLPQKGSCAVRSDPQCGQVWTSTLMVRAPLCTVLRAPWIRSARRACSLPPTSIRSARPASGHEPNHTRLMVGSVCPSPRPLGGSRFERDAMSPARASQSGFSGLAGSGRREVRIQTSCAVVAAPTLDLAFARWCFTVECDRPRRWAAAFSDPATRTAATTPTSRSVARPATRQDGRRVMRCGPARRVPEARRAAS